MPAGAAAARAACKEGRDGCVKCAKAGARCLECERYWHADGDASQGSPAYGLTSAGTCVQCRPQGTPDQQKLVARCDGDEPTRAIECSDYEYPTPVFLRANGTCALCSEGPAGDGNCTACACARWCGWRTCAAAGRFGCRAAAAVCRSTRPLIPILTHTAHSRHHHAPPAGKDGSGECTACGSYQLDESSGKCVPCKDDGW